MSNPSQPPTPPEMNDPAAGQSDEFVYVPIDSDSQKRKNQISDQRGGINGCLIGLGGTLGCLLLVGVLLGGALIATGATLNNFLGNFVTLFRNSGIDPVTKEVYIPEVEPIQQLSELSTVKYGYAEMVVSETNMPDLLSRLYGNSLVLVAVGNIRAGVDLSELTAEDIIYDEAANVLTLRLPAPRLQECFLNDNETYVAERRSGLIAPDAEQLDTESRRFAVRGFRDRAIEEGILQEAAQQAETVVQGFVESLTDDVEVRVTTAPVAPDAPLPDSCQ